MNKINWMVRIQNKAFWLSLIPAVLLLVQVVAAVFGYQLELGELGNRLLAVVNALFAVLAVLGVITDPTTSGMGDSARVLGADKAGAGQEKKQYITAEPGLPTGGPGFWRGFARLALVWYNTKIL